jgi:hypothetical protein
MWIARTLRNEPILRSAAAGPRTVTKGSTR